MLADFPPYVRSPTFTTCIGPTPVPTPTEESDNEISSQSTLYGHELTATYMVIVEISIPGTMRTVENEKTVPFLLDEHHFDQNITSSGFQLVLLRDTEVLA